MVAQWLLSRGPGFDSNCQRILWPPFWNYSGRQGNHNFIINMSASWSMWKTKRLLHLGTQYRMIGKKYSCWKISSNYLQTYAHTQFVLIFALSYCDEVLFVIAILITLRNMKTSRIIFEGLSENKFVAERYKGVILDVSKNNLGLKGAEVLAIMAGQMQNIRSLDVTRNGIPERCSSGVSKRARRLLPVSNAQFT